MYFSQFQCLHKEGKFESLSHIESKICLSSVGGHKKLYRKELSFLSTGLVSSPCSIAVPHSPTIAAGLHVMPTLAGVPGH